MLICGTECKHDIRQGMQRVRTVLCWMELAATSMHSGALTQKDGTPFSSPISCRWLVLLELKPPTTIIMSSLSSGCTPATAVTMRTAISEDIHQIVMSKSVLRLHSGKRTTPVRHSKLTVSSVQMMGAQPKSQKTHHFGQPIGVSITPGVQT